MNRGIKCRFFGCVPKVWCDTNCNDAYPICQRCDNAVSYSDMVEDTPYKRLRDWIKYWFFRKWIPAICRQCGRRYGNHYDCIPF